MKICVIGPAYPYKGGIAHYNNWLCNFISRKHDLRCISFKTLYPKLIYPGKEQKDLSATNRTEFKIIETINSINPLTWISTIKQIKKFNPDIVLLYWWTPYFSILNKFLTKSIKNIKKKTKPKIIYLCHNVVPHEDSFIDNFLSKLALKEGNYFIVHAKKEKENLLQLLPKIKQNTIIPAMHPTYAVQFKFKEINQSKAKKKLNISGKVILFFGYIREYKGLMYLIEAMPHILKEFNITLLIVGEFWKNKEKYINKIKELKIENNVCIIDEYVPDEKVGDYYSASDLIILPYLSATNSGIAQIAYGFEKPVIATNVGGLPEVIINNKTGFIVPPKNSAKLAKAIIKYYTEKKEQIFKKNIIKEKERFSWERMVEIIENLEQRGGTK